MPTDNDPMGTKERDEAILEFLNDRNAMFKPKALFDNLNEFESITFGYKTVQRRLRALESRNLVERVDDTSYYRITDRGRSFLTGELEVDESGT